MWTIPTVRFASFLLAQSDELCLVRRDHVFGWATGMSELLCGLEIRTGKSDLIYDLVAGAGDPLAIQPIELAVSFKHSHQNDAPFDLDSLRTIKTPEMTLSLHTRGWFNKLHLRFLQIEQIETLNSRNKENFCSTLSLSEIARKERPSSGKYLDEGMKKRERINSTSGFISL